MIWNHYALTDAPGERRTLCGVELAERNAPRFNSRSTKNVNCKLCRKKLAAPPEEDMSYVVQIPDHSSTREIIKLLAPVRDDVLAALRTKTQRLRDLTDGRDIRPHYTEIAELGAEIRRLQVTSDVMAGYKVDLDSGQVING